MPFTTGRRGIPHGYLERRACRSRSAEVRTNDVRIRQCDFGCDLSRPRGASVAGGDLEHTRPRGADGDRAQELLRSLPEMKDVDDVRGHDAGLDEPRRA